MSERTNAEIREGLIRLRYSIGNSGGERVTNEGYRDLLAEAVNALARAEADTRELREALERIRDELPMGAFGTPIHRAQQIARSTLEGQGE